MTNITTEEVDVIAVELLTAYQKDVERWRERKSHHIDIQPLVPKDVMYLKAMIHPTNRKASKEFTIELIKYICEKEIVTAKQIYQDKGFSDNPVLTRLKILKQLGYVRRERKKYYLATPRLVELCSRYLNRL